jgi:hypothetical protein
LKDRPVQGDDGVRLGPAAFALRVSRPADRNGRFLVVSIVRIGLAETKKFSEGYEAIFGKKKVAVEQGKAKAKKAPAKAARKKKKRK